MDRRKDLYDSLLDTHHELYSDILEPHRLTVYKLLLMRTGNHETAEDLTQETLMRAYVHIELYPEDRVRALSLPGWLFTIAKHLHLNEIRKHKHNPQFEPIDVLDGKEDDKSEEPEVVFELKEYENVVKRIVSGLPDRFRKVLVLCLFHELTNTEIAKALYRPVTTVRADLHHAKKLLRKRLEEEDTG